LQEFGSVEVWQSARAKAVDLTIIFSSFHFFWLEKEGKGEKSERKNR